MTRHAESELVIEAFVRNGAVNRALLEGLAQADFALADAEGGWTIAQHLAHMIEARHWWLGVVAPAHAEGLPIVAFEDESGPSLTTEAVGEIVGALERVDAAMVAAVREAHEHGRSFVGAYASHPGHFLVHTLVHDSHHRGQVVRLLRVDGRRTAEGLEELEGAMWSVWRS
jgi:uncharacterized damage-inducible protein DinB